MLRNALWTWGTYWEPIRNLEGTPWEHIGKQGKMEKKSFYCPSGFRGGFILPFLYKARTGPAGTLPCPARPCWPPSQPVSPSPVPSPSQPVSPSPVLATVTASQPLSRAQPALAGHRHSQSFTTSVPSTGLKPELRHRRTDVVNLYIRCEYH
jgi:hypothetical protein